MSFTFLCIEVPNNRINQISSLQLWGSQMTYYWLNQAILHRGNCPSFYSFTDSTSHPPYTIFSLVSYFPNLVCLPIFIMIFTIFSLSSVPFPHSSPMLNHMPHHLQKWICLPQCLDHPRYLDSSRHRSQMVAFVWACWKLKLPQLRKNISRLSSRWDSGKRVLFILFHFLYGSQLAIQGTLPINPVKKIKEVMALINNYLTSKRLYSLT